MKTRAPFTARPPRAVTWTRTVIGSTRLVTGFGENRTCDTTRRSPAACSELTDSEPPVLPPPPLLLPPTVDVGFEIADVEPRSFRAVTRTRSVRPVSASRTTYSVSFALGISLQLSPWALQRSQTYEYVIGSSPAHSPRFACR